MAQVTKHIVCVSPKNTHTSSCNVGHLASLDDTKHRHLFLFCPEPVPLRAQKPCEDRRPQRSGALAEPRLLTGYEPKQLSENQDYKPLHGRLTEHKDSRIKPLSFHQSITASTYDSAESIATRHPESDLDDEQLRALMASPLHLQERESSTERSQVYHSERENVMCSSSQDPISTGKLVALFSSQNIAKYFLDGNKHHLLAEARSDLMKREYKVEILNTWIGELQQQTYAQRLELEDAHLGYAESQREQSKFDYKKNWS